MDLTRLFYPRSIAVVGASPKFGAGKIPFYQILQAAGYAGELIPVNPSYVEIAGVKVYADLEDLPGPVDLAIVSVPARKAVETLAQAAKKGIPFAHFFTAGFAEAGNADMERALLAAADGRTRIVGPNCIGVLCAESRVTFDPGVRSDRPGVVGFAGQSGGVTNDFVRMAQARGLLVNKAVSYGNQIDLRVEHYLEYFAKDEQVRVLAAYLEDVKDGRAFIETLKRLPPDKPLIVLKGGVTPEGAVAAQSHTAALAGNKEIWSALFRQLHCLEVHDLDEMVGLALLASADKVPAGPRVGFLGAGGGTSVLFADLAVSAGLEMPELAAATQELIARKIKNVNTSTRNPVDLGAFGFEHEVMENTILAMDQDPNLDVIVPYYSIDFLGILSDERILEEMEKTAQVARGLVKAVVPVIAKAQEDNRRFEKIRVKSAAIFRSAGLAAYSRLGEAVGAIRAVVEWRRRRVASSRFDGAHRRP